MKLKYIILSIAATVLLITACTTAQYTRNPDGTTSTSYAVDPKLTAGLATAGAVNSVTAAVNPYSPAVEIGLTTITALAAWVAKRKTDKANQQSLLLKTVIQGVENGADSKVKAAIQAQATAVGVEGELGTTVQKINSGIL
jgi:hypothetical protein